MNRRQLVMRSDRAMGNDSNLGGKTLRVITKQNIAYRNYLFTH
jgi:hypothetical protein